MEKQHNKPQLYTNKNEFKNFITKRIHTTAYNNQVTQSENQERRVIKKHFLFRTEHNIKTKTN